MTKITVFSSFADNIEINLEKSAYIPNGSVFFVQDLKFDILKHIETVEQMKREHDRLQARYDNLLKGLNYWKGRCKELK